jgi:hypothetical protein
MAAAQRRDLEHLAWAAVAGREKEPVAHWRFTLATDAAIHFCDAGLVAARHQREQLLPNARTCPRRQSVDLQPSHLSKSSDSSTAVLLDPREYAPKAYLPKLARCLRLGPPPSADCTSIHASIAASGETRSSSTLLGLHRAAGHSRREAPSEVPNCSSFRRSRQVTSSRLGRSVSASCA